MLHSIVAAFLLVGVFAAPFPPPTKSRFVLYFGANGTAPTDTPEYLALAAAGGIAGYGWQQASVLSNFTHGEENMRVAAAALSLAAPSLPVFVYRHFQMAWRLFDVQRAADDEPAAHGMFLRDNDNEAGAAECRQTIPGGGTSPLYAFVNESAGAFWVSKVVGELVRERGPAAVFFDETDWSACGYDFAKDGCANISDAFRARDLAAKLPAIRGTADALVAGGKWPIFSSKNILDAAWEGLPPSSRRPCVVPHDAYFNALKGVDYCRFYEFFMGQGPALDAATIANVLLEGAAGVGLIARTGADAEAQCASACTEGSVGKASLPYALAAFLVAKTSPYSFFAVSGGWYSPCWCWHGAYDAAAACGEPLEPAVRTSPFTWTRRFEACDVAVNTTAGEGSLSPRLHAI